jgi:hypothetical protein
MRQRLPFPPTMAAPLATVAAIAVLVAGCGGGGGSSSSTAAGSSTTTNAGSNSPVCATFALVQASKKDVEKLDPSNASPAKVKKAVTNLGKSVKALSSAASKAGGQAGSQITSATTAFQSQLDSASGQPVPQQLATLGNAIGQLESSLTQTMSQLKCGSGQG